jgi:hypothetical protein
MGQAARPDQLVERAAGDVEELGGLASVEQWFGK